MASAKIMDINDGKECAEKLYDIFKTRIYLYLDQMGMTWPIGMARLSWLSLVCTLRTRMASVSMTAALAHAQSAVRIAGRHA